MSSTAQKVALLAPLARGQLGLVTFAQALKAGLQRSAIHRLERRGLWKRVLPGIYVVEEADTFEQGVLAACLWAGPHSVASHGAAGRLLRLDGLESAEPEVLAPPQYHPRAASVRVHRGELPHEDRRVVRGIPQTSAARTLVDLASVLEPLALAIAVEDAWRRRLVQVDWVERRHRELAAPGRRGVLNLREVLEDCRSRGRPLDSALEVKFWWMLRRSGLPLPEPQADFEDDEGQPCRIDFAYADARLAVEVDGFEFHSRRDAFERDRVRLSRLAVAGWRVIHVTAQQMRAPQVVLGRIRAALAFTPPAAGPPHPFQ